MSLYWDLASVVDNGTFMFCRTFKKIIFETFNKTIIGVYLPDNSNRVSVCLRLNKLNLFISALIEHLADTKVKHPVDLADAFDELKLSNCKLLEQIKKAEKELYELFSEYHSAKKKYQKNNCNHLRYIEEKENHLKRLLKKKGDVMVIKKILEKDLSDIMEKVQSLEQDNRDLNNKVRRFDAVTDKEIYQNQDDLYSSRIKNLEGQIKKLSEQNKRLFKEKLEYQNKSNISEKLLESIKDEFGHKIDCLEKQILEQGDDIAKKEAELSYLHYVSGHKSTQIGKLKRDVENLLTRLQQSNKLNVSSDQTSKFAHNLLHGDFKVSH